MSYQRFVAPILAQLPPETFRVIVTGDIVEFGKPHPEPYLTAAAALGLAPADCIAVEDSNTGAKSAESAGCLVLVVENHVPVLAGERRVFADSLDGHRPRRDLGGVPPLTGLLLGGSTAPFGHQPQDFGPEICGW